MPPILHDAAATWTAGVAAAVTLLGALLAAWIVGLVFRSAEGRLADRGGEDPLDAAGRTRLRVIRRLAVALTILTGVLLALLQFDSFDRLARAALASGALLSAVIGFAARDSLGNAIAGVSLALTQPIRVGDIVEIAGVRGTVEDVTLTTTCLRAPDGARLIVPNSVVTTSIVRNDSIGREAIEPSAAVWIDAAADAQRAVAVLEALPGVAAATAEESQIGGTRLGLTGARVPAGDRPAAESRLRGFALAALRDAGIEPPRGAAP